MNVLFPYGVLLLSSVPEEEVDYSGDLGKCAVDGLVNASRIDNKNLKENVKGSFRRAFAHRHICLSAQSQHCSIPDCVLAGNSVQKNVLAGVVGLVDASRIDNELTKETVKGT